MDVYYEVFCPDFSWYEQVLSTHNDGQKALEALAGYRQNMWPGETVLVRKVTREVLEF